MPWEWITVNREGLYAEIWKEPVVTVATRYQVSDVGLLKICAKLGVPVPQAGYWTKIAAGLTPPIAKLPANHEGDTQHAFRIHDDPEAPERERRIAELLEADPIPSIPAPILKAGLAETHKVIRCTARALKKREYHGRGLLHADAEDAFEMSVSPVNKERALLILAAVIESAAKAGGVIEPSSKTKRPRLNLRGMLFELTMHEPSPRRERELTAAELKKQNAGTLGWIPNQHIFVPSGKLRLEIHTENQYQPVLTLADAKVQIESRLESLVPTLMQKAAELTIERQMRDEEEERDRIESERRQGLIDGREAELARLGEVEKKADRRKRAETLREYANALPTDAAEEVAWIHNAADWLDPIVDKHWPEVDVFVDDELNDIDAEHR